MSKNPFEFFPSYSKFKEGEEEEEKKTPDDISGNVFSDFPRYSEFKKAQVKVEEAREEVKQEKKVSWLDKFGAFQKDLGIVSRAVGKELISKDGGKIRQFIRGGVNKVIDTHEDLGHKLKPKSGGMRFEVGEGLDEKEKIKAKEIIRKEGILPELKWYDKLQDVKDEPEQLVPFVAGGAEALKFGELLSAANKLDKDKADKKDIRLLQEYVDRNSREASFGYKVLDVVSMMPSFAGELYATGGVATAGRVATVNASKKVLKSLLTKKGKKLLASKAGQFGMKVTAEIGARTLQTPFSGATRIPAGTLEKQLQSELGAQKSEWAAETFFPEYEDYKAEREDIWMSATKSLGGQWVETVSEFSGGILKPLSKPIKNKLLKLSLFGSFQKANPTAKIADLEKIVNRLGYHGVLSEMFEERMADVGHGVLYELGLGDQKFSFPSGEQLAVELVAFSVPGVAISAINKWNSSTIKLEPSIEGLSRIPITPAREMPLSDELKKIKEEIGETSALERQKEIDVAVEKPKIDFAEKQDRARDTARDILRVETLEGKREDFRLDNDIFIKKFEDLFPKGATSKTEITVYRASATEIKEGDQVTTNKANVEKYLKIREGSELQEAKVKIKDLVRNEGLRNEFVYAPKKEDVVSKYLETMRRPKEVDFQSRVIAGQDLGKEIGKKVNPDGTLTLYHGTSKQNAESILRGGRFNEGAYFSVKKTGTEFGDSPLDVAKRKFGKDATVMEIKVDARTLESAAAGSEVFSPKALFKEDGIWKAIKPTLPKAKPVVKSKAEEVGLPKKKEEVRVMKPSKAKTGKEVVKELLERGMDASKGTTISGKYPRPLIGKVELKTLFKNSDEFKKKPILIVNAEKNLEFKGEKTEFTIKPEALNFKKENLVVGEKILVDEKALKEKGAQMQMRVPMRKSVSDKLKILQKELDEITDGKNPQSVMDELQESIAKPKTTDTQKEKYQKTIDTIKKLLKEISKIQPGLTIQDVTKLDEKERMKIEKTVDDIISEDTETKKEYEKMKDVWFGDKDERILETQTEKRLLQRKLKQVLGQDKYNDKVKDIDKAIHIYIDTKRNPAHIKEYWDKLSEEQQKIVTLSQNLPDNIQKIANIISEEYENIGLEALGQEVVHNVLDNYVGRIWDLGGEYKADQSLRKFGTTTRHAKARKLETIIEGWAKRMNLKVEGATGNLEILKTEIIKTIEDKRFIKLLKGLKIYNGSPFLTSKLHIEKNGERVSLDGYVEVKHPNFVGWEWAGKTEEGEAYGNNFFITEEGDIMEKRRLYAPKEYADNLNNILGVSTLMEHASIRTITKYNAIIKAWILQSSFFHHLAFARSYYLGTHGKTLKEMNIVTAYKDGIKSIEELEPTLRLLVRNGLTLGIRQDWEESFLQEKTPIGKILDKTKATKQTKDFILKLRQDQADFLFGELGAGLKAKSGLIEFRNLQKKYPNKDVNEVAKMAANLINDDFGGLHLGRMGRNPTLQHIFRLFALAPDWTESNIRSMVKAINYKTPRAERAMYQRFWAGILTKGMLLTVVANLMLSFFDDEDFWEKYKIAWESGRLHWLDVDITPIYRLFGGKSKDRRYFSIFGHFKDPFKFILHPIRSAHYKGSVVYGFFHEALSGTDWSGRKFTTYKEFLGIEGTKKDPSKYKGQTVKYGIGRPIEIEQIPSFLLNQLIGSQPVQVQNLIGWYSGEMDGFDAVAKSMGLNTSRTYTKEKSLREKELISAVEKWESGDRSFMIRRKIEKELIDNVYSETYSEGKKPSKSSTNNLRKDFRIYAEFGFENEIVNEIMRTQLNEDKVDILIKAKEEMEGFDEFYKKAKKVNLLSDDVRKQFFKSQR